MARPGIQRIGFGALAALAILLAPAGRASAAQVSHASAFSLPHTVSVSTGLVSIGGTFTNTTTATATPTALPQFNPALGRLTKATVTIATPTATFVVTPTGLLSLVAQGSGTRRFAYGLSAGASSVAEVNELTTSGSGLLTLLGIGGGDIGGAPLNRTTVFTAEADLLRYTGAGTLPLQLTATDTLTITALVSLLDGGGMNASGTYAGTVTVTYEYTPWPLAGSVYNDTNRDGVRQPTETGTGLVLHAKLLSNGVALQAVPVDPSTGRYAFAVSRGNYRVVIDDNATLADVTPLQPPAGWTATQADTLARDVVVGTESPSQDFGLALATAVRGRVFLDTGVGGGTAHDGVPNGAEPGGAGRQLLLATAGGTVLDRTTSASDGTYRLFVPNSVAAGTALRVRQTSDPAFVSTGGGAGNTGGSYSRAADEVAFTFASGSGGSAVNFGSVPAPTLTGGSVLFANAGATVTHGHLFQAGSAGTVEFGVSAAPPAWPTTLLRDTNANGQLDAADTPLTGPVAVSAGQTVALLLKVTVPEGAPYDTRTVSTVSALVTFPNATPALTHTLAVVDQTAASRENDGALALLKSASLTTVLPGGTVVYTMTFTNQGLAPLTEIDVHDSTPAYTKFAWAAADTTPAGLAGPTITAPAVGGAGAVRWRFTGSLAPGASGSVKFAVVVD